MRGRSTTTGNFEPAALMAMRAVALNTQTTVYNTTQMLQLITIHMVTPTHLTTSAKYTCGLSIRTNILLVF